jgi:hypothetical protein
MSVCVPCTRAGIYVSSARQLTDPTVQEALQKNAAELHATCRGGTWCDCQHSVNIKGELNTKLIAELAHADSG